MKLLNGDRAVVEDAKLLDYILSPTHPIGRHHAALFEELLGITRDNADILRTALLDAAMNTDVTPGHQSAFGPKFEMRLEMAGPEGPKTVLAVWLIESSADRPRLITCYVE